jgi:hypothetical protein
MLIVRARVRSGRDWKPAFVGMYGRSWHGHAAMSDLIPLCAQKRKLNVTTIWIALAICCVALIGAAALWA